MSSPVYLGVFQTSPNSSETCNFHYKVEEPIVYDLEPFPNPLISFCYAVFVHLEDSFRLSGKFRADGPVGVSMDNVWTPVSHSHIFQSLRLGSPRHSSVTSSTWPRGHALLLAPRSLEAAWGGRGAVCLLSLLPGVRSSSHSCREAIASTFTPWLRPLPLPNVLGVGLEPAPARAPWGRSRGARWPERGERRAVQPMGGGDG